MTFSVEVADAGKLVDGGHAVEIYIDRDKLASLIKRLTLLADEEVGDHVHLMTEAWGLGDLTDAEHADGNVITHHLKVILA